MTKIKSFEDLIVWRKARGLVNLLYDITATFPKEERFILVDQIRRAVLSVMANIAEGFSRYHLAETLMFYRNARGSLTEVKSHLYICLDRRLINTKEVNDLFLKIDEVGKMLNGLISTSKSFRKLSSKLK